MTIALILVFIASLFSAPALAEGTGRGFLGVASSIEITVVPAAHEGETTKQTVTINDNEETLYDGSDQLKVLIPNAPAGQYLVLLAAGPGLPEKAEDIYYIDQKAGNGSDLEFTVYPTLPDLSRSMTLFITGTAMETAIFSVQYYVESGLLLGDVNGDSEVNAKDLTTLARHVARIEQIEAADLLANADVDRNGDVSASDLTKLARYVARIINTLD